MVGQPLPIVPWAVLRPCVLTSRKKTSSSTFTTLRRKGREHKQTSDGLLLPFGASDGYSCLCIPFLRSGGRASGPGRLSRNSHTMKEKRAPLRPPINSCCPKGWWSIGAHIFSLSVLLFLEKFHFLILWSLVSCLH